MARDTLETVRLGVAGAGLAVRDLHWPAIHALGARYQIVALAARTDESLQKTGQLVGCDNYYHDYKEMIDAEKENLDAVLISLPISMLYEGAEYAARAGLDVLCEKPVGQNLEEGKAFVELPERYGVSVQILENFRYRDDLQRARELIDDGAIGELYMIRIKSLSHTEPEMGGFAGKEWRQKAEYKGGALLDGGVHHMAAFHVLAGSVARIGGVVTAVSEEYEGIDNALFTMLLENEAIGEYTFSYTAFEDQDEYTFFEARCYGTTGSLLITDGTIRHITEEGEQEPLTFPNFDNGYYNEFLDFYEHKTEGKSLRVTPTEAFKDLHLLLSGLDAAKEGRVLDVNPGKHHS
ncbi:MAG: Gfo/Idh/MocA family oxidoreductase [Chloroflexota bacterium]|nr:Gfo/Idh/MocA family oxidoreductase [Chloroflexota bacterium]